MSHNEVGKEARDKVIEGFYLLKKFPGKGGWTYTEIPELQQNPTNPFGWVTVSGSIEQFALDKVKLMPMGNGQLFLSVKSTIRKAIKKEAGDIVQIKIYIDESDVEVPKELKECFRAEPEDMYHKFMNLKPTEKKSYIDWIYNAKTDQTKARRIVEMMIQLGKK